MNSIHDLGGMHGLGPLPFEENEPLWHGEWEKGAFGINILLLMTGVYTADESRYAMEKIPALHWLASPYYLHWLDSVEQLLLDKGLVSAEELQSGHASAAMPEWAAALQAIELSDIEPIVTTNHPVTGDAGSEPKFKVGDRVRALNIHPRTHTRLPRYVRGHIGTIAAHPDAFVYADDRARGLGDNPKHTYSVRFEGVELWGPDAGPKDAVYIDLYETYLEAIDE